MNEYTNPAGQKDGFMEEDSPRSDFDTQETVNLDREGTPFLQNSAPVYQAPQEAEPKEIRPTGPSMPTIILGLAIFFCTIVFLALGLLCFYYGRTIIEGISWSLFFPIVAASLGFFFLIIALCYGLSARSKRRHSQKQDRSGRGTDWKGQFSSGQEGEVRSPNPSKEETSARSSVPQTGSTN